MASITMQTALPACANPHSPHDSSLFNTSSTSSLDSKQTSPSFTLPDPNTTFVFPAQRSPAEDTSPATSPMAIPMAGGSHGRRASRQGRPALPDFDFNPGAAMAEATSPLPSPSPKTHPILEEMAANSRQVRGGRPAALPPFSFNPGIASDAAKTPSPTKSTFGEVGSRQTAHRRGGSELVGGDTTQPIMSTSPIRSEHGLPRGPPISNAGPRGHRHKRSGALSVAEVDLSSIIKANAMAKHRPGSAPSTPADVDQTGFFDSNTTSTSASPSSRISAVGTPPASPTRRESAPGSLARPRVAFSDTIAEIPRPLSMISSETEGSTSTVRANHSLSGSVSSFTSPPRSGSSLSISREDASPPRPKTAGILDSTPRSDSFNTPSGGLSPKRPLSASGTPSPVSTSDSPLSKKKYFWSSAGSDNDVENEVLVATPLSATIEPTLPAFSPAEPSDLTRPRTSPERKASIKRRKVRTWTGGIFSRKGKQRAAKPKGRRTPTPPMNRSSSDAIFDDDNTVVIQEESAVSRPHVPLLEIRSSPLASEVQTNEYPENGRDVVSPVIDLDAALGPFGSEEKFPQTSSSSAAWARLHSNRGGLGDASSPYHRRAESAPHLAPVNRNSLGFHRMGSNPSMTEEVLYEEEEDEYLAGRRKNSEITKTTGRSDGQTNATQATSIVDETDPITEKQNLQVTTDGNDETVDNDNVHIVEENDEDHCGDRSSGSTILPPVLDEIISKRPASVPLDFAYPNTQSSYASSGEGRSVPNSAISSPEADHISFDSQNLTASRYPGDGRENFLRPSTDDVPSLTDSVSTATGNVPRGSSSGNTTSSADQRSASFSGVATWSAARASKRASLVSLTRLIPGSSHGERSKLRMSETAQDEHSEKQKKKGNRLSRLMTFWRPKERS